MTKYNVGDRVRVVREKYGHEFDIGSIVTITALGDEDSPLPYYAEDGDGDEWRLSETEIASASDEQNNQERLTFTVGDREFYVGEKVWAVRDVLSISKHEALEVVGSRINNHISVGVRPLDSSHITFVGIPAITTTPPKTHEWKFGDWARHLAYGVVVVIGPMEANKDIIAISNADGWKYVYKGTLTYISSAEIPE